MGWTQQGDVRISWGPSARHDTQEGTHVLCACTCTCSSGAMLLGIERGVGSIEHVRSAATTTTAATGSGRGFTVERLRC